MTCAFCTIPRAPVVSSDECNVNKKNFDAVLKQTIKAKAAPMVAVAKAAAAAAAAAAGAVATPTLPGSSRWGYDKNIPQPSGMGKFVKVLRPIAEDGLQQRRRGDLARTTVALEEISERLCWDRGHRGIVSTF